MKKTQRRKSRRNGGSAEDEKQQLVPVSTRKVMDIMSSQYVGALSILSILNNLRGRGLSLSVCLLPHGNVDVGIKDTDATIKLLERMLPTFVGQYLHLVEVATEATKLWCGRIGEESPIAKEVVDLMDAIRWGSKVVINVLLHMLLQSDDFIGKVMQSEALQKLMANVPVLPPQNFGGRRKEGNEEATDTGVSIY